MFKVSVKTFSICSSVFIEFAHTNANVFHMLKQDGSAWFSLDVSTIDRSRFESEIINNESELLLIWYQDPETNENLLADFWDTGVPIVPHSWYHICLGLDTESGLLRIVVNGVEVVDEERDYFRNTTHWKPVSVKENILVFKGYVGGFWYQFRSTFSNLNIFSSLMSVEDMVTRTAGGEGCDTPGDYLRY